MIARALGAFSLAIASLTASAQAATVETELVRGVFVSEHKTVAPGEQTVVAFDMALQPGWHTYWKNAGDSGQAVEVNWTAPEGVHIGEISWPAPHRQPFAPLMNYGYEDAATLLMPVTVPTDWPAGKPIDLKAEIFWLVCKEVCIPEQGETTLSLKTGETTVADETVESLFTDARAAVPRRSPYGSRHQIDDKLVQLRIETPAFAEAEIEDVYFFPDEWGVIDHAATQVVSIDAEGLTLAIPRSPENEEMPIPPLSGILEVTEKSPTGPLRMALAIEADKGVITAGAGSYRGAADGGPGFFTLLFFALIGGVILNLMPCVFPVLALKAIGFAESAQGSARSRVTHGVAYTLGVLTLFALLAGVFLVLKSAGLAIGWGFQLQNPYIVGALAYLLFLVGLNLSGVFEVTSQFAGVGSGAAQKSGPTGAFFTGALAAVVATPCTAPFMATAMGATLTMSAPSTMAVFLMLGFGLALPFLLLSVIPAAARMMPAPGPWMMRLKELLAFPMYASAAWLVWVLGALAGPDAVLMALIGGVLLGLAAWAYGVGQNGGGRAQLLGFGTAVIAAGCALGLATQMKGLPQRKDGSAIQVRGPGEPFTSERLANLRAEGKPVFINMTADWCITCKVNEKVAFGTDFEKALTENGVTYLLGDWTARDPEITALLEKFGRAGVPLYAVFPRSGDPRLLPQFLTSDMIVNALGRV